jgi:hypothetical protein
MVQAALPLGCVRDAEVIAAACNDLKRGTSIIR